MNTFFQISVARRLGLALMLVGSGISVFGAAMATARFLFALRSLSATGTVIDQFFGPSRSTVVFTTQAGRTVYFLTSGCIGLHVGERIPVKYGAGHPALSALVNVPQDLYLGSAVAIIVGLLIMFCGWLNCSAPD